jgi:hypothetical protein
LSSFSDTSEHCPFSRHVYDTFWLLLNAGRTENRARILRLHIGGQIRVLGVASVQQLSTETLNKGYGDFFPTAKRELFTLASCLPSRFPSLDFGGLCTRAPDFYEDVPLPLVWMTNQLEAIFGELGITQYLDIFLDQGFDTWETILDITESDLLVNLPLIYRLVFVPC